MLYRISLAVLGLIFANTAAGQGQDSAPYERDLQVIAELLSGGFDNANQNYFDKRGDHSSKHRRIYFDVKPLDAADIGSHVFTASAYWDNEVSVDAGTFVLSLSADIKEEAVRMRSWRVRDVPGNTSAIRSSELSSRPSCDIFWRREAQQFSATSLQPCDDKMIDAMVLGPKQMWMTFGGKSRETFKMHRVRNFECYADIPGVGGGRPEAYERYEDFHIHDQGGAVWFTTKDGRELGISLFLVDWPINNYEGIFTRDSFVIYVSEEIDGERKEHGYAFTVPQADRIGINLKWMLASCFMKSNKFATPYM